MASDVILVRQLDDLINTVGVKMESAQEAEPLLELDGSLLAFSQHHPFLALCLKQVMKS